MSEKQTRLNKFLASCGVGSRRSCDQMILDGLVWVNGKVETKPATRVSAEDFVKVDGKRVQSLKTETLLVYKPRGLVCSKSDELERETVFALIPQKYHHLNHVGRLDKESEGLLILSNDGELAQALAHPSKKIEKEYIVTTDQAFDNEILSKFLKGIYIAEGKAQAKSVKRISPRRVKIVLETGLKRQIRSMFQAMNIKVKKLVRVRIGALQGDGIEQGKFEVLDQQRIDQLFARPTVDHKATTLKSQAERRPENKKTSKKWTRPTTRSHDGFQASDRPARRSGSSKKQAVKRTTKKSSRSQEASVSGPPTKTSQTFKRKPKQKKPKSKSARKRP